MTSRRSAAHRAPGISARALALRAAALAVLLLGSIASVFPVISNAGMGALTDTASPATNTPSPAASDAPQEMTYEEKLQAIREHNKRVRQAAEDTSKERTLQTQTAVADAKAKADAAVNALNTRVQEVEKKVQKRKEEEKAAEKPPVYIPESCAEYSGNQAVGCALLEWAGFGLDQMDCLVKLWNKESGWRVNAANPSGAYGIPQAKPGSKMAAYGGDWETNPETQIKWGLQYIKDRYNTPCGAWATFQSQGWY